MTNQRQPTEGPPEAAQDGHTGEPERILGIQARAYREKLGMTQAEVARAMTARGFTMRQTTIAKIEASQRPVRVNEAVALAAVLHAGLADLLADPAQLDERDDLAAARDAERELMAQVRLAERRLADSNMNLIGAQYAAQEALGEVEALRARYAEAQEKTAALSAVAAERSASGVARGR